LLKITIEMKSNCTYIFLCINGWRDVHIIRKNIDIKIFVVIGILFVILNCFNYIKGIIVK